MNNLNITPEPVSNITVIGVGGAGNNAVNQMHRRGIMNVNLVVCNTDAQMLYNSPVSEKLQLGEIITEGRGAGNKPETGRLAAMESIDSIKEVLLRNTNVVCINAGMGGGTGTGAAPVIAKTAKELGILTVAITTIPFKFEGPKRLNQAIEGIKELKDHVDSLLIINNDKLREIHGSLNISESFKLSDDTMATATKSIANIIATNGYISVNAALKNSNVAMMGTDSASGENRALKAIGDALKSPLLLNNEIAWARSILVNITSGEKEITEDERLAITDYVVDASSKETTLLWSEDKNDDLADKLSVTVIATGYKADHLYEPINTKQSINKISYGIDFGTTNSSIGFVDKGALIHNFDPTITQSEIKGYTIFSEGDKPDRDYIGDRVDCTVFCPDKIKCGESLLVQVFAHFDRNRKEAEQLAIEFDDESVRRGFTSLYTNIDRGSKLSFELSFSNLEVDFPIQSLYWQGRTESVEFEVQLPEMYPKGNLIGKIRVLQNNIPIGHIRFKIKVLEDKQVIDETQKIIPTGDAKKYEYAFISYASEDREEVLRRVQMLSPLRIRFFQDIMDLEPGVRWAQELYKHIDKADVFFLFWSHAASRSEWILKEIKHALERKCGKDHYPPEILPIILEGPPIPDPPEELKHLHFSDKLLYFLNH